MSVSFISRDKSGTLSGEDKVPSICRSEVFPAPEGPTIAIISPALISKSMFFRILTSPNCL